MRQGPQHGPSTDPTMQVPVQRELPPLLAEGHASQACRQAAADRLLVDSEHIPGFPEGIWVHEGDQGKEAGCL